MKPADKILVATLEVLRKELGTHGIQIEVDEFATVFVWDEYKQDWVALDIDIEESLKG